ncbi:acyltransferase [Xanthocytophaga flava]|uniref:acyltransferase n=1 Tax=Xanthocytophaga flava TaxID=3048013 RepID=UPI0028D3ED1F|nr:acyltransferase [Xanthocytophaga flavus]MDJ1471568.1 acyltransferase [Xanthocytophaga flavus]
MQTSTLTTSAKRTYNGIDLMKFLAAFLVISIHTRPFYDIHPVLGFLFENIITRVAVPFFFISSGFLFFTKVLETSSVSEQRKLLVGFLKRILVLYLLWTLIYLPYDLYFIYKKKHDLVATLLTYLQRLLLWGSHFHLWYLLSLMYCTVIVYFFVEIKRFRTLLAVGILLYLTGLLGDTYHGLLNPDTLLGKMYAFYNYYFDTTRNLIFFGSIFLALGAMIAWYRPAFNRTQLVLYIILFGLLYLAEALLIQHHDLALEYNMYLFLVPLVTFLFLWFRKLYFAFLTPYVGWLRTLSLGMYCSHGIFMTVVFYVFDKLGMSVDQYSTLFFIGVTLLSLCLSWLMAHSKNKWIQRLIS